MALKVVISGYYGFHNVGDEAILSSMIQALKKCDSTIEITVLSNDPAYTEKTYGVRAVNRWSLKEVTKAIRSSDGLISGGGSLLQDKTGGKSILYYTGIMFIANLLNKPVFIYAQGMGPIDKKINQWITKIALQRAKVITVRDEASKQLLEKIGVRKTIEVVPDPVMGLNGSNYECHWFLSQGFTKSVIAVSVRDWPSEYDYETELMIALDEIAANNNHIVFLPMHGENDEKTSKRIAEHMQQKSWIAPYDLTIEEKIGLIKQSQLVIGMRLHALIFAALVHTPFLALSYDPKIDAFAKLCDQPVVAHVNEKWQSSELTDYFYKHMDNIDHEREKLRLFAVQSHELAHETAKRVITSFQ